MPRTIRVMLVEDNPEYADVVKLALDRESDIELTGRFGTTEVAIKTLKDPTLEMTPDVILLDLRLPGMDGLDSLPFFIAAAPATKVIVLTQSDQENDVFQAISSGASGYLLKSATLQQLTDGIRAVASGGSPLDAGVARYILRSLQPTNSKPPRESLLSARELEILTLLADGMVKKQIAKRLKIGYTTVDTHVGRIYEKLNVNNAPAAVDTAHRMHIFGPRSDDS